MSKLDKEGMLISDRITHRRFQGIEKGSRELEQIVGIIIHQTDSPTAQATLNAYNSGGNGAFFDGERWSYLPDSQPLTDLTPRRQAHQIKMSGD